MSEDDTAADDVRTLDWLTGDELLGMGVPPEIVARLPHQHTAPDGRPCWHRDELSDLLRMADTEYGEGCP